MTAVSPFHSEIRCFVLLKFLMDSNTKLPEGSNMTVSDMNSFCEDN